MGKKMLLELGELLGVKEQISIIDGMTNDFVWIMIVNFVKEEWDEHDNSVKHLFDMKSEDEAYSAHESAMEFVNGLVTSRGGPDLIPPEDFFDFDEAAFFKTLKRLIGLVLYTCKPLFYPTQQEKTEELDELIEDDTDDEQPEDE